MKKTTVRKSIRVPDTILGYIDLAMKETGRSQSAELAALIEEGLIALRNVSSPPSGLSQDSVLTTQIVRGKTVVLTLTMQSQLVDYIDRINDLLTGISMCHAIEENDRFSEKVRYLLSIALRNRGKIIGVELETLNGELSYDSTQIMQDTTWPPAGISERIDLLKCIFPDFRELMRESEANNEGMILLTGKPGTGKTILVAEWMRENSSSGAMKVHYMNVVCRSNEVSDGSILVWKRTLPYKNRQILVLDEIQGGTRLSSLHLKLFVKQAHALNVAIVCITQLVRDIPAEIVRKVIDVDSLKMTKSA